MMGVACCLCKFANATVCSTKSLLFSSPQYPLTHFPPRSLQHLPSNTAWPLFLLLRAPMVARARSRGMMFLAFLNQKQLPQMTLLVISKAGYFHKVQLCNRASEQQSEFLPFVIEDHVVGFIHNGFVEHLTGFSDVFIFPKDGGPFGDCVSLHPLLKTAEERTSAVGYVVEHLGEQHIPGIRNELYPVKSSFGAPIFFSLERAAAPYFGTKVYRIQMNGYVGLNGQKHLWIGKRSPTKSTYPGMLDQLVAGGLPHGIDCRENVVKECKEEVEIPRSISIKYISPEYHGYLDLLRSFRIGDCS